MICRELDDCRCGAPCVRGAVCAPGADGPAVCAEFATTPGRGVCVSTVWATGGANGTVPCGASRCAQGELCVDWGPAGPHCSGVCSANSQCASGCCVSVADSTGAVRREVCAPSPGYRCLPGTVSRGQCSPACGAETTCVSDQGAVSCETVCSDDTECAQSCCRTGANGLRVCATDPRQCSVTGVTPGLAPACTVLDGCVEVTWGVRGQHCASIDSVDLVVRNNCPVAADIEICVETRLQTCQCGIFRGVQPGAETTPGYWVCNATGRYGLTARAANDAPGCHGHRCN